MTSPTTASDRRGLPTAFGSYASGLSAGQSLSAARSVLAVPTVGDAFADVFSMIASVESPAAPEPSSETTSSQPGDLPATDSTTTESAETENEVDQDATEPPVPVATAQPLAEPDTVDASSEPEPVTGTVADSDAEADSDSDADQSAETDAAALAAAAAVQDQQAANEIEDEPQAVAEPEVDAANGVPAAATSQANPTGPENTGDRSPQPTDAADTPETTDLELNAPAATTSETDPSDAEQVVAARYAGDAEDGAEGNDSGSHRRLRGQKRGEAGRNKAAWEEANGRAANVGETVANDAGAAEQTAKSPAAASAAGLQDNGAANALSSGLAAGQPGLPEAAMPVAAVPLATMPTPPQAAQAAAASAASVDSLKASGSDAAATARTDAAPSSGAEPTVSKEVRSVSAGKETNEGPRVADRALLVQRVSRAFQRLGFDGGQVRIRLHPEELGGVQLQLSVQGQRLSGRVVAETEAARSILTEHLPELRQRLADQGMQVERLEVQLEGEQDPTSGFDLLNRDATGQGGAGQGDGAPQRGPRRQGETTAASGERSISAPSRGADGARSVIQAAQQKSVDLIG